MSASFRLRLISLGIGLISLLLTAHGTAMAEDSFPGADGSGFLPSGEYIYENPDEGIWRYLSATLRIEIIRFEDTESPLVWTVADIRAKEGERFRMTPKNPEKRMARMDYIPDIARENGVVFAITSDYAHLRIQQKITTGILIRDGQVLGTRTRPKNSTKFPNLDTLALFDDGDMRVFVFNEHTPEEYLAMGATDVLAFGPILIRDGVINEEILKKYGKYREPRVAIGMVEKGHYISIMAEGRHDGSKGVSTLSLAQLMADQGCVLAFNLDGGQSAAMVFMGNQIIRTGEAKSARSTAEILGIGHSTALPAPEP